MSKYIGDVSAYAYAVSKGYAGTEEEFAELMADYAEVGQRAEDAADRAEAALDEFTSVTADATTLPEGSSATAEYSDGHLTLGIPKGDKGDTGAKGDGAVYAVIGNTSSVIPVGTDGYLTSAYKITIPVTFYSGKDNVTGSVTSSDLYISRSSGGSGEMDTVRGSTYRNVQTATIIYAIPAGWRVGSGRITLTVTIGTVTLTYYHTYTIARTGTQGEQGIQGPIGATPNLTIGTVTTLQPTAPATATITGTADNPVLSFGIPKGDTGEVSQDQFDAALALKADVSELLKAFPTDSAQGAIASFTDGAELPIKSLTVDIEPVQDGTGDPSPDNVRPISGHTQAVVTRTGVNVWDEEWEVGSISADNGENATATDRIRSKNYISVVPGVSYYFKASNTIGLRLYDGDKHYVTSTVQTNLAYTIPANIRYVRFIVLNTTTYNHDISINYPATDTDYHEGHVQSINIQLGQTVYGGTLDVLSGELVIDRAMVDLGTLTWGSNGTDSVYTTLTNKLIGGDNCVCSALAKVAQGTQVGSISDATFKTYANSVDVAVKLSGITNKNAQTMLSGFQFVYPLATPLTIQLTPHEVRSLLGFNNVWADTGDTEVTYRADPTLYIQRKIAEALS